MKRMLMAFLIVLAMMASPIFADSLNYTFSADDMSLYANFTNAGSPIQEILLEDQLNLTAQRSNLTSKDGVLINFTQYGYTTIFFMLGMQLPSYIDSANVTNLTISAAACDDGLSKWSPFVHSWQSGFSGFSQGNPAFNCDAIQATLDGADSQIPTSEIFENNSMGWAGFSTEDITSEASIDYISVTVFYEGTTTTTTTTSSTTTSTTSTTTTSTTSTSSTTTSTSTTTTSTTSTTLEEVSPYGTATPIVFFVLFVVTIGIVLFAVSHLFSGGEMNLQTVVVVIISLIVAIALLGVLAGVIVI